LTDAAVCSPGPIEQHTTDEADSTWSFRSALIAASTATFPVTINFDLPANSTILLNTTAGNALPALFNNIHLTVNGTLPDGSRVTIGDNSAADAEYPLFLVAGNANAAFVNIVFRATFFELSGGRTPDASLLFDSCELYGTAPTEFGGPAIFIAPGGELSMRNSAARNFRSSTFGGVIQVPSIASSVTTIDMTDCLFENNVASDPAYIKLTVIRTKFVNNQASQAYGGAIELKASSVTFTDSEFIGNSAFLTGGAICMLKISSLFEMLRCRFSHNSADVGGAIVLDAHYAQQSLIKQCVFQDNTAVVIGGAMHLNEAVEPVTITECLFLRNKAVNARGGAMIVINLSKIKPHIISHTTVEQNSAGTDGGGFSVNAYGSIIVAHTTFFGNSASDGMALFSAASPSDAAVIDVYNSVLVGDPAVAADPNKKQILGPISTNPSGTGHYLQNCFVANNDASLVPNGTLRADTPLLGPLLAVDSSKPWTASRSPLQDSPLVDAAGALPAALDNVGSVDQRGNPRVAGAAADIGSVEQGECVALIACVCWLLALRYCSM